MSTPNDQTTTRDINDNNGDGEILLLFFIDIQIHDFQFLFPDSGMSGGSIAIIVIVCLFSATGGIVFLIFLFKRDSRLRKMFNYQSQPTSLNSFENVAYEKEADPSQLNK